MIATILPSSSTFHAVDYNERKVSEGVAELLEMKNFGFIGELHPYTPDELKQYLMDWSSRNDRIQKPQFHLAISCRGDEYTQEQLLEIAHKYLQGMGYMEDGQPLLIYSHHDTDNNHLHIVTSRVAPDGRKINDHHERVRSQVVLGHIMGDDQQQRVSDAVQKAMQYHFTTSKQFQAILESMGYECYERNSEFCIKRDGHVIDRLKLDEIEAKCKNSEKRDSDEKRRKQLRAILKKYRDMVADKDELRQLMHEKFGIDLVFHGSKDKPYGYTIIDHKTKTVFKGSEVLKLSELLQFISRDERLHRLDEFIDAMLEDNPNLTTRELNRMFRRQFGTHISHGRIVYGDDFIELQDYQTETLEHNDREAWFQQHPQEAAAVAHHQSNLQQQPQDQYIRKPQQSRDGSRDQNREWEVGHQTRYDDIDDERSLKR